MSATAGPQIPRLPGDVLTQYVFPFVGVRTLVKCALVSREWKSAVDEDVIWKRQCALRWVGRANVPHVNEHSLEPDTVFPLAVYHPAQTRLTTKDIKQVLALRGVDCAHFIERSEFEAALVRSQPAAVSGWSFQHASKWKSSYVYSKKWAVRNAITRQELIRIKWRMEFKFNDHTVSEARFMGDQTYQSTLGGNHVNGLLWEFVPGTEKDGAYGMIRIGQYPALTVRRGDNWEFELENDYVIFRQHAS